MGRDRLLLLRNSAGRKDGMWTVVYVSFVIWCLHALIVGLAGGSQFGSWKIPDTFSWATLPALLPAWAAYIFRRREVDTALAESELEDDSQNQK